MLNVGRHSLIDAAEVVGSGPPIERHATISATFGALRKNRPTSIAIVAIFLALGLAYALTSTPLFTANSQIMIDARRSHANETGGSNRSLAELGMDPASIDSQVAVLGSEAIAIQALKQLHLEHDMSFTTPTTLPALLLQSLKRALGHKHVEQRQDGVSSEVLEGFMRNLSVKRMEQTYVLSLSFTDRSPERAATIVNTIANVYAEGQVQSALAARKQTDGWIQQRLASTRDEIGAAQQAVRSLRSEMGNGDPTKALVPPDPDRLRRLEQNVETQRTIYAALVDRANAALQSQTMPVSDVTILKPARAPERRSQPNVILLMALSGLAGLAAATGVATWRNAADRTFRLPSQIDEELGVRFLGVLPRIRVDRRDRRDPVRACWAMRGGDGHGAAHEARARFAGPLRAVPLMKNGGSLRDKFAVVGVTSALRGEGRSTVALNLGGVISAQGRRTVVVGADLRRPRLGDPCAVGLAQVIDRTATLDEAVTHDEVLDVDVLPASPGGALDIDVLEFLLDQLRDRYDVVILDLPPLSALHEVSALAPAIGVFVLVTAWGRTQRAIVAEALRSAPAVADRTVGAILNGVRPRVLRRLASEPRDLFLLAGADGADGIPLTRGRT